MKNYTLVAALFLIVSSTSSFAEVRFTITELPPPAGAVGVEANAINDRGQVVGVAYHAQGVLRPVLWEAGVPTLIPGGPGSEFGYAQSINNRGNVGLKWWDDLHRFRISILKHDRDVTLRPLDSQDDVGVLGLNDHDHAVGFAGDHSGRTHAVLWRSNALVSLGIKGETGTMARDIDNSGRIVGHRVTDGIGRAFQWHHGRLSWLKPLHAGAHAAAVAVNNNGRTVGGSLNADGRQRPVTWSGILPEDLSTLPGHHSGGAWDINDGGQVVGASYTAEEGAAVLWQDGNVYDLNHLISAESGWWLYQATAVNNVGQIIGRGTVGGREARYLLTPVPEPAFGLGLTLFCIVCSRRRLRR